MNDGKMTAAEWRQMTLKHLYPLTIREDDPRAWIRMWHGMLQYAAGIHQTCAIPGRPDAVDFSGALLAAKSGFIIKRESWPANVYVVLQTGYPGGVAVNSNTAAATGLQIGETTLFLPYLMKCHGFMSPKMGMSVQRAHAFGPWHPSGEDMLADDWQIVGMPGHDAGDDSDVVEFGPDQRTRAIK